MMEKVNVTELCRDLRKNMTDTEKLVWEVVKSYRLKGLKFRRQHPIFFYYNNMNRFFITDFYCGAFKLVIEIDGKIHNKQKDYDELRDTILKEMGFTIIRIKNEDIYKNRKRLADFLEDRLCSLTPLPPLR